MQKLQLSIPEPCHENWHNMTPTDQGRFCNACVKEVVDFSMMTDTEVLNYFTTITHEKVCGRALPSQLDRTITWPKEPKKRLFWYWNYIVMFFMFFSKSNTTKAQGDIKPVTELAPVKPVDISKGDIVITSWVLKGKVIDKDGNPVPFATIKIKHSATSLSADAIGEYSVRVKPNDVLVISGTSFKPAEVHIGSQTILNTVLENGNQSDLQIVIVARTGWTNFRNLDEEIIPPLNQKYTAALKIKDDKFGIPIDKAKIIISRSTGIDTVFTDKKGIYKLKRIKEYEEYYIKIEADGYQASEFTINSKDFKDRKKEWEVLLRKQALVTAPSATKLGPATAIRMGAINGLGIVGNVLYIVDGKIMQNIADINPDDVEECKILQAPEATALFGAGGYNGALVITTRQAKTKTLDSVTVKSDYYLRKLGGMTGGMVVHVSRKADLKARINTFLNDSLKVYPNPVQRGNAFNISLKLKQTGNYNIQITDAAGRIVLQKQTNIPTKEYIEKLQTDTKWGSGLYYIRVFDTNNKPISKSSFIVQ